MIISGLGPRLRFRKWMDCRVKQALRGAPLAAPGEPIASATLQQGTACRTETPVADIRAMFTSDGKRYVHIAVATSLH